MRFYFQKEEYSDDDGIIFFSDGVSIGWVYCVGLIFFGDGYWSFLYWIDWGRSFWRLEGRSCADSKARVRG